MAFEDFQNIEFGICRQIEGNSVYHRIPIDRNVKTALSEMYDTFYQTYLSIEGESQEFSPSEKYGTIEKLFLSLGDENVLELSKLFQNNNIPINEQAFSEIAGEIHFYFGIFYHNNGNKLIGIKRPSQFKGLLKKRGKLVRWVDDSLEIIDDDVFKLDSEFDFVMAVDRIDILHPAGFIFISDIYESIMNSAIESANQLGERVPFINFQSIAEKAGRSKTAAKLIASIRSRDDLERTSQEKLLAKCRAVNIPIVEEDGQIYPENGNKIDFLYVLDRRQYEYDLTEEQIEIYRASSRRTVR